MLVGRESERHEIDVALASSRSGSSATLALIGEPGIGKSALLDYAAGCAAGMGLLRARGVESEVRVPFAGLLDLLRPALGLLERIPSPQARALEQALALRPGAARDRFAVGAATLSLLAAFAEQSPALVLLDDVHLLDRSSADALLFALRRLLAEPICVLLAARSDEPSLLDELDPRSITLAGLDRAAAASLIGPAADPVVDRLHATTAGNPLALLALRDDAERLGEDPTAVPMPVPAAISGAFARRIDTLDADARRLLVLIAAAGGGEVAILERAAAALGVGLDGTDAAREAGLLRVEGGHIEFSHPLAQATSYGEANVAVRREAHRALADALPDRDTDRRAWHLAAAAVGSDEAAAAALEQAGTRARERSAYAAAAAAFERAASLSTSEPRAGALLLAAAEAAWSAGMAERTIGLLAQARELGAGGSEIDHLAGRIAVRRGPVMAGYATLLRAADHVAGGDRELAITILAEAVDACFYAGAAREMEHAAGRISELLGEGASAKARFLVTITGGMSRVFAGEGSSGIASIREAIALAETSSAVRANVDLQPWLVMGPLWVRETEAGRSLIGAAIANAREDGALSVLPWLLNRIARSNAATDSWSAADVEYDEAIRLARETHQHVELAAALAGLSWLDARLGRADSCRAHAAEALRLCGELGVGLYAAWAMRALGELELALGHAEAAARQLEQLTEHLTGLGIADVDLFAEAELVDAYLRLGRGADAARTADELEQLAVRKGQPWSLARAARCRGLLDDDFEAHFERALTLHEQTPDLFESAMTALAYGSRLRRARQRRRARERLREALGIFDRLGARLLAEAARSELAATGERARRRDASTLDDLTPQELHIAQLLSSGRTTREAAAALFLSPKTIEYHLRSVYRKLGVNSRSELARALEGEGG